MHRFQRKKSIILRYATYNIAVQNVPGVGKCLMVQMGKNENERPK